MPDLHDVLVSRGLKLTRAGGKHGGEYHSPCPVCGGKDRFRCWPAQRYGSGVLGGYSCRQCGISGDFVQFFVDVDGLEYSEAFRAAGAEGGGQPKRKGATPRAAVKRGSGSTWTPNEYATPPDAWRDQAEKLVSEAHTALLGRDAELRMLADRGLPLDAVKAYRLGYVEGEKGKPCRFRSRTAWGLAEEKGPNGRPRAFWIPRGVAIPFFGPCGRPWRIRMRRPQGDLRESDAKYIVLKGSHMGTMVLGSGSAIVPVEAELDAMAVAWACSGLSRAAAMMTNLGRPDALTLPSFQEAGAILVALDFDKAGADGWRWWEAVFASAKRWPVPAGKDPGDYAVMGGDLRAWVLAGMPPVERLRSESKESKAVRPTEPQPAAKSAIPCEVLELHWLMQRGVRVVLGADATGRMIGAEGGLPKHSARALDLGRCMTVRRWMALIQNGSGEIVYVNSSNLFRPMEGRR